MSIDLVIAGATIKDETMIHKAIASAPEYPFSKKFILLDGLKEGSSTDARKTYDKYCNSIENKYSEFIVIRFDKCVYFREMIKRVCEISEAERLFVIQDDVECDPMLLEQIVIQMNYLKDLKILCFPHKYIGPEGSHWYEPFDDSYPIPFIKSHGFSERTFICDRVNMLDICIEMPANNKMNKRFIEFIYQTAMKSSAWRDASDQVKEKYWEKFGCYYHYLVYHKHLCGKR
tara:strand:- start:7 stop:699 length:693 start_codon:yes stop_codon:yes gene_type:complete